MFIYDDDDDKMAMFLDLSFELGFLNLNLDLKNCLKNKLIIYVYIKCGLGYWNLKVRCGVSKTSVKWRVKICY